VHNDCGQRVFPRGGKKGGGEGKEGGPYFLIAASLTRLNWSWQGKKKRKKGQPRKMVEQAARFLHRRRWANFFRSQVDEGRGGEKGRGEGRGGRRARPCLLPTLLLIRFFMRCLLLRYGGGGKEGEKGKRGGGGGTRIAPFKLIEFVTTFAAPTAISSQ